MRSVQGFVEGVLIEIYDRAIKDEQGSEDAGIPIFKSSLYIKKRVPNSRDVYDQPVKNTDHTKYPDLFKIFEEGGSVSIEGTPLEEWALLSISDVETLKALNIYTVQNAAELNETSLHRLPVGLRSINVKAKKWLSQGSELETLKESLVSQEMREKRLMDRIEALEANQKKKPGRPRKTEAA